LNHGLNQHRRPLAISANPERKAQLATNDVVLLDSLLQRIGSRYSTEASSSERFELFCFDQMLKQFDPTYDELSIGWVDGGNDGGIDGFFVYIDGRPCTGNSAAIASKLRPQIHIKIVSSRSSPRFEQQPLDSLHSSLSELLDLTKTPAELMYPYNSDVLRQRERFSTAYLELVEREPILTVTIDYCSRGDASQIAPNLRSRADALEELVRRLFGRVDIRCAFFGATELLHIARKQPDYSLRLPFTESYISREGKNFVVLSRLSDYFDFISDDSGQLRRYLFESNVRDYLGHGQVNKDIAETVERASTDISTEDFWWLNNGVTILCTRAVVAAKSLAIENVQIINGLQTTETIFNVYSASRPANDQRALLVKVIVADEDSMRARIIKATNYQSTVDLSSIRGLDKIQKDIEQHLEDHGWFYDRRRNFFKNQGKSADRIVAVTYLASAVRAVALGDPANSPRQRAKSLRDEAVYSKVFNPKWSLSVYLASLEIVRAVELALQQRKKKSQLLSSPIRLVHFVAFAWVCLKLSKSRYTPEEIVSLRQNGPTTEEAVEISRKLHNFTRTAGIPQRGRDGISLNAAFMDRFLESELLKVKDDNKPMHPKGGEAVS
jgi:hypothetical protein